MKRYAQNEDGVALLVADLTEGTPTQFAAAIKTVLKSNKLLGVCDSLGLNTNNKSLTRLIGDVARKLHGEKGNQYLLACFPSQSL